MISIAMATYNGEKYLRQQVDSILCQLGKYDEFVVSDNCSTDATVKILKSYNDSRIKIFSMERNARLSRTRHGIERIVTENFENALMHCSGDFVFLADQDDIWLPCKIRRMLPFLENHELVMCNATTIDGGGNVLRGRLYEKNPLRKGILSFRARGCLFGAGRKLCLDFLPVPKSVVSHDLWLGILAEARKSVYFLDEPLVLHRRNIGNVSSDVSQKSRNSLFYKIYYRANLLVNLAVRLVGLRFRKEEAKR